MVTRPSPCAGTNGSSKQLSYKFQRLREQIRNAIASGEFTGQLPGERELGRRFSANAKTINKALCDLSSEGLLFRQIGRGTFVAPKNGQAATPGNAPRGMLLMPVDGASTAYRIRLMDALKSAMRQNGATLDVVAIERLTEGQVPLAGWPLHARRSTSSLACYPVDALSGGRGHLDDECVLECFRRQVPIIVVGALSRNTKVNAVAPDYTDAGLQLAEHLFQSGCESLVVLISAEGREAQRVCAGAQAAGFRLGKSVTSVITAGAVPSTCMNGHATRRPDRAQRDERDVSVGVLCVGSTVLNAVSKDDALRPMVAQRAIRIAGITEPGDDLAATLGVTSYDVNPQRIAEWAARLLIETRPGQPPLEILIPGDINVRVAGPDLGNGDHAPVRRTRDGRRDSQANVAEAMI